MEPVGGRALLAAFGVYRTSPAGRVLHANGELARIYGYPDVASLLGADVRAFFPEPSDYPPWRAKVETGHAAGGHELQQRRRDGTLMWIREHAWCSRDAQGKVRHYRGVVEDVTARRLAERFHAGQDQVLAMVATDAPLRDVLSALIRLIESQADGMLASILLLDQDGRHIRHGAAPSLPQEYVEAIDGESIGPRAGSCGTAMYRRAPVIVTDVLTDPLWEDYPGLRDLATRHGLRACWSTPILTPQGAVLGSFAMYHRERRTPRPEETRLAEIATSLAAIAIERRRAEEALHESEETHRSMVENASYGIFRSTPDGRFLTANPALVRMLGFGSKEAVIGLDVAAVLGNPADRERIFPAAPQPGHTAVESTWRRRDGRAVVAVLDVRPVLGARGELLFFEATAQDVTQERALEAQLRQSQKMEAIGRLAGGVAHDFNNLLTAISGYAALVFESLGPEDPRRGDVEEIRKAADQAAALTRQMLAFSRKQLLTPRVIDVNALVVDMGRLLRRLIGEDIILVTELEPTVGSVRADLGQLQQVLLNLVVNARDAMPGGGRLTLRTANVRQEEVVADERHIMKPGGYVMVAVSDTGIGMDEETSAHVFEPFFTTKERGKGTGLGLATVYGLVKQSEGYVWVRSAPGQGATFEIYLPRVDGPALAPAPPVVVTVTGGHETLLLVEDAPAVRAVARVILERAGYSVLEASNGADALAQAERHAGPIDLLVTDVVMPGMDGPALAGKLRAIHPETRVLYVSGYTSDAILRHGIQTLDVAYLPKPFTPETLARKVREVLDQG